MQISKEIYSVTEIANACGVSKRAIQARAIRQLWPSQNLQKKGGGKGYPLLTLPDDVKAVLIRHKTETTAADEIIRSDGLAIPEWSHGLGLARYTIVAEWRTQCNKKVGKKDGKKVRKSDVTASFLVAYNSGQILQAAYKTVGQVSQSSLYRWDQTLRDNGDDYTSLCDGRGKWAKGGAKGEGQLSPEAQKAFLAIWLTPNRPAVKLAYEGMKIALERAELPVPCLRSAYNFAARFEAEHYDVVVVKRGGEKALNDKVSPYIARKSAILNVGDCLVADGHTLNFECLHPDTGKPFRPTLLLWFDWKSEMPVGWEFMPVENTIAISAGLRMGTINLGMIPKTVYLDNGRAFKAKYFTKTGDDIDLLDGLYTRLGIVVLHAKPYHGQSKIVERFFGTMNEQFSRMMPSYTGRDITDKPSWRNRNEPYHTRLHEKNDFIPTLREAAAMFEAYVKWYADQPLGKESGQTRGEVFLAGRGPGVDIADLDDHFLWTKKVKPTRCGFTLAGVRYESDMLYGLKKEVIVKYTWADLSEVYLYTLEGLSLGRAKPQIQVHPVAKVFGDDHDRAMVADSNKRIASLKKTTMRKARLLDQAFRETQGYEELPYCAERHEPPALPEPETAPPMSEEQRAHLDAVTEQAKALMANGKEIKPPEYFKSELDRYEWLFMAVNRDGYQATAEEAEFMKRYEASDEYKISTGARYIKLREMFDLFKKKKEEQQNDKPTL